LSGLNGLGAFFRPDVVLPAKFDEEVEARYESSSPEPYS
jgi:hypothetical protein